MAIWNAVSAFTDWMWGNPLLILLVGGGIILAFIINFIQIRKFGFIWRNTIGTIFNKEEQARKKAQGVSPLQVLIAAVGATVGTGNIVGVSSAIAIGGPGALFWMFICGFIAMGIKYSEVTLGVEYREKLSNGQYRGGPFMDILKGLGWKPVAYIFGICSMVCMAMICCVHGSSMTSNAASIGIPPIVTLVFAVIFMLVVCFGGMKALCKISDVLVPVMSILYILAGLIVILINIGSDAAIDGRMGSELHHFGWQRFAAGDQAQCALNGKRAKQANPNQCPQNTVDPLRCPFQHDSKHNDRQNQPTGGNAHIEQLQK